MATAMKEPTPGRVTVVLPTLMASEATTKNQPPDMDIIMFQISGGMPKGTSRRQNRSQDVSRTCAPLRPAPPGWCAGEW